MKIERAERLGFLLGGLFLGYIAIEAIVSDEALVSGSIYGPSSLQRVEAPLRFWSKVSFNAMLAVGALCVAFFGRTK